MNKRILFAISWMLSLLLAAVTDSAAEPKPPPNVLVILADDMGFSDAGCYGGEIQTPNLDRLAGDGLRFSQFYSTGRCWPSRSVLLTGYYAQQVGMDPRKGKNWPPWTRLVPHYLKEANYRCYHSGKWHVRKSPLDPKSSGFDRSYWTPDQDRYFSPTRHLLDDKPLPAVGRDEGYYATTTIAGRAIEFLQQHQDETADQPFYLYLAFIAPHFPLHALPEDIERYRDRYKGGWDSIRAERFERMKKMGLVTGELSTRKPEIKPAWNLSEEQLQQEIDPGEAGQAVAWEELTEEQKTFQAQKMAVHAAMIDRMDQEIGRVLEQLKAMDAFENTLIFFVSDNGASAEQLNRGDKHKPDSAPGSADSYLCLGPGWSTAANTPLTLHKYWNHEGGIASPLIMHWPEGIKARGAIRKTPGHFVDVLPTILDVAGLNPNREWNGATAPPFPGISLRPAFEQEPDGPPRTLYFDHKGNRALREGDWKIVQREENERIWELYNLAEDRSENHDLAKTRPELLQDLVKQWKELERQWEADRVRGLK